MSTSTSKRNAGIQLITRINRWMIAGTIALAGAISVAAENSFHGHTATAASSSQSSRSASSSESESGSSSSGGPLQQPAQAPSSAPAAAASSPVVSGGS